MRPVHTTSATLLERLRQTDPGEAWVRFVQLYTPLLFDWSRRLGLQDQDAADLVQDVFTTLVRKLPEFQYDRARGFRRWLRTVLLNRWRDLARRRAVGPAVTAGVALEELPAADGPDPFDEVEYRQHLLGRALRLMQAEFSPNIWKACWEHVVLGRPAADVAADLGICAGTVYVAKSRVLCRLRQELEGLLD
jgi:RNA polymerase sigma-70 factor (ECF subfamily)